MTESMQTRMARWGFNLFPAFRGTGGRITYIAGDWSVVRVKVPLSWRTRNYVGTIFGGSMYAAADPIYMIMLIKQLGHDYTVWDKGAQIRFHKPGRTTLYAQFEIGQDEIAQIREALQSQPKVDREYTVALLDRSGEIHATIQKTIHIRRRERS
jgi:acyl-coenzyme A thioesterase PaaI-like protein